MTVAAPRSLSRPAFGHGLAIAAIISPNGGSDYDSGLGRGLDVASVFHFAAGAGVAARARSFHAVIQ